jgi:hypothetical protein
MFRVSAYVTEVVPGRVYLVDVDGFEKVVTACGGVDDGVVTFKSALVRVLEHDYGDCDVDSLKRAVSYDAKCLAKGCPTVILDVQA